MSRSSPNAPSSVATGTKLLTIGLAALAIAIGLVLAGGTGDEEPSGAELRVDGQTVRGAPPAPVELDQVCEEPTETPPAPSEDLQGWLAALPTPEEVGTRAAPSPGEAFGLRADEDVLGVTLRGGSAAALRTETAVVVGCSLLAGAIDGLKPADGTLLRDSVVRVAYEEGDHADHVQLTDRDRVQIRRVLFMAENDLGTIEGGWNAAVFVHGDSTDWVLEDIYVQAGDPALAIQSWFPIRLGAGSGSVRRVVIDRATMRGDTPVLVEDSTTITTWEEVHIREEDGSLTPVPRP